jgi:hypothetical protein
MLLRSGVIFLGSIKVIPPIRGKSFAPGQRNSAHGAQSVYSVLFYVIFSKKATAKEYKPLVFVETCGSASGKSPGDSLSYTVCCFFKEISRRVEKCRNL